MKLSVWIRPDGNNGIRIRTDYKCESGDTPRINATGNRILTALEGDSDYKTGEDRAIAARDALRMLLYAAAAIDLSNLPDLTLRNTSGCIYALKPDVWNKMSTVIDCVNAVRTIQKGLKDERKPD